MTPSAQEQVKEDVAVETKGESPEERFLKETPTRLLPEGDNRNPVLGAVRINFLIRKNGNTDFDKWFDGGYKTEAVRNEMKVALIKNGCPEVNVSKFLLNLEMKAQHPESKDTSPAGIAYDELKYLVEKANKQKESYDEAMGESDKFKSNVVLDSLKNFWNAEVTEGIETKPLATFLKIGGAGVLAYLAWEHIVKANKLQGKVAWGAAIAGTLYLINGYLPHAPGNDDEKTGLDFIFPPKVDSPAMQWFLNKVGMGGSREKVSIMMRIANVKMDKLIGLYQQSSNGQIDIGELIDDPNLSEKEITELQKLNTYRMRTALYRSISETVKLAGVDSTEELRRLFKTETLLSVIMQLYSEQPAGQSITAIESGADASMSDSDRKIEAVIASRNEPNGINVLLHDDRIWINSYPFKYKIENDNVVFLNDNGQPIPTISSLPLTGDNQVAYEKSLNEAKTFAESAAKTAIAKEFKVTVDKVQYTGTSWSVAGKVPAKPTIGLDAPTSISLSVHFLPNGQVKLDNHEGEGNVQEALIKEALAEKISSKGLSFATGNKIEIKSYDETNGYIEAIAKGTSIKLKYEAGKYLFVSADWANGRLLDSYKDGMSQETGSILDTELKDLKINGELLAGFNLISNKLGVDSDEYKEFRKLYESKGAETGRLFAGLVSGLNQDGTDLDIRISESRTKVIQDLRASLQSISANFNTLIQTKDAKISESQFRSDYIAKLQEAGISSGEYRTKFNAMMTIVNKTDYRGNDRLNNTYYEAKTRAVQLFFEKTGRFANNTSLSALESAYVDNVTTSIDGALNSALNEGWWVDDIADTSEVDKYFAKVRANIPDYGASNTPPNSPEVQKTDPKALEVHKEQLDTKEKAFSECKRYVGAHFDSLKEVVQAQNVMAQKPSLFEGMLGMLGSTSTGGQVGDNIKTQWDTLVDLKKDKIVGSLDQS
ncbi:MAG: hypothetical protein WCT46_06595, partial [Candidatus Gracilibacteria bacterium]